LCGGEMSRKMRSRSTRGWMLRCGEMPHLSVGVAVGCCWPTISAIEAYLCLQRRQHVGAEAAACGHYARCMPWRAESTQQ
jgi:hypothetical protein